MVEEPTRERVTIRRTTMGSSTTNATIWVSRWHDHEDSRFAIHRLGDMDKWVVYHGDKPYYQTVFSTIEAAEAAKAKAMGAVAA
jgi:hypothetical protein